MEVEAVTGEGSVIGGLRRVLAIAWVGNLLLLRDRTYLFFLFVAPLGLVLMLGLTFGGGTGPRIGVVAPPGDELAAEVVAELESGTDGAGGTDDSLGEDLEVVRYGGGDDLRVAVERRIVEAGVVFPEDYGARLRRGDVAELGFLSHPSGYGAQLQTTVRAAVGPQTVRVQAAGFAVDRSGDGDTPGGGDAPLDFASALERAGTLEEDRAGGRATVETATVGDAPFPADLGPFDIGASSQLLLFIFVNGLASSLALIQSRDLGITRRVLSTPTSTRAALAGEGLGRFGITLFQGVYIMVVTWVVFGVDWGDPVGASLVMVAFAAVAAAAAMLLGAVMDNASQAEAVAPLAGLGLAAVGGSMAPLEVFTPTMRDVAHVTPHAWGNDAFASLVREGGGVSDILIELGVLGAMAAVLFTLATWRLRRRLTSG